VIRALYELALRENLLKDPDFEPHRVDLRLRITPEGDFHSFIQESEGRRVLVSAVPRLPTSRTGGAVRPGYFFDNPSYVLGHDAKGNGPERLESFRSQVIELAQLHPQDPELQAFLRFLNDPKAIRRAIASRAEWTGSEWIGITVLLDPDATSFLHESKLVRGQWATLRGRASGQKLQRCLITGALVEPVDGHAFVKMPGTKGAVLVSFNEPASCLSGVKKGLNAPMSRAAAEGYATALNWLLERTPERRHRGGISLGDGHVLVFWTKDPHPLEAVTLALFDPQRLVTLPWRTGESGAEGVPYYGATTVVPYYGAILSTRKTRIVVRSWIDTTVDDVCRNLDRYVEALHLDGVPTPSISTLLWAAQDDSPDMARALFLAAIRGTPFPAQLLDKTLHAVFRKDGHKGLGVRCALLKAVLSRLKDALEVPVALDETCTAVPYLCGRGTAVMEQQQYVAHRRRVNSNIIDNFLRSASTSPARVFGDMLALSQTHAAKILKRGGGQFHEILKNRILEMLPAAPLPVAWSKNDQTLFLIGYHHQREALFSKKNKS
jgi:CRISPR-associated protein Csd1